MRSVHWCFAFPISLGYSLLAIGIAPQALGETCDPLDVSNVVWTTPSADSSGSMPLGNGDIGLNVWTQENGDVCFYISKTDAWDENCRLIKIGRVRIALSPNPFRAGQPFSQVLRLRQGAVEIRGRNSSSNALARIWVDANAPIIHVDASDDFEFNAYASLELWRTQERPLKGQEIQSAYGMDLAPHPVLVTPDTVVGEVNVPGTRPAATSPAEQELEGRSVIWYHRNRFSIWAETLKLQGMASWMTQAKDPLLDRTFGAVMLGDNFERVSPRSLRTIRPALHQHLDIHVLTAQTPTAQAWIGQVLKEVVSSQSTSLESAWTAHLAWWDQFWNRSWIRATTPCVEPATTPATGPAASQPAESFPPVALGYTLQRFVTACAGRGAFPIKFNGSIFTVDAREPNEVFDADYRRWGGPYWFQNTRLLYWPMLAAGDFEMMLPLFRMYQNDLPFFKARTRTYFNHDGAFFPETMYFWGSYANSNYGWDRTGKPPRDVDNTFIRWHYNGTLELLALMLQYYQYTQDEAFLRATLLPMADEILSFWQNHFPREPNGHIEMKPAQALETYQNCVNPAPDVAGIRWLVPQLMQLSPLIIGRERRERWSALLRDTPELPTAKVNGRYILTGAQTVIGGQSNVENPELYSIFPYRIYGVGRAGIDLALQTFAARDPKGNSCWFQDDTQAAMLGLAQEARQLVSGRFAAKHSGSRFPAFWASNSDWMPDEDHGGNGMMALQSMLLQSDGKKLFVLPAWPKDWDVNFKLHAPMKTIVEGEFRGGKLVRLRVDPTERTADVILPRNVKMPATATSPG